MFNSYLFSSCLKNYSSLCYNETFVQKFSFWINYWADCGYLYTRVQNTCERNIKLYLLQLCLTKNVSVRLSDFFNHKIFIKIWFCSVIMENRKNLKKPKLEKKSYLPRKYKRIAKIRSFVSSIEKREWEKSSLKKFEIKIHLSRVKWIESNQKTIQLYRSSSEKQTKERINIMQIKKTKGDLSIFFQFLKNWSIQSTPTRVSSIHETSSHKISKIYENCLSFPVRELNNLQNHNRRLLTPIELLI